MEAYDKFKDSEITIMVTGSGGLSVTDWLDIPFIQEVVASTKSITTYIPSTDVAIELGGEDAKITYLGDALEQRMNSICAGGTGAFIDQMASLLETDAAGLNELAKAHDTIYPIASRCGVFAKTDIQALVNQGASRENIAASVFQSVVNQTISNLACGRPIEGRVAFLGGPLFFLSELRERFAWTLNLKDEEVIFPKEGQLYVALGAGISSVLESPIKFSELKRRLFEDTKRQDFSVRKLDPLFKSQKEYDEFKKRHSRFNIKEVDGSSYEGWAYLGIDAGSTTTKAVVLNEDKEVIYSYYGNNKGKPMEAAVDILREVYTKLPGARIKNSCVTGYGEDFIKAGLGIDEGEVETIAHYRGAKHFAEDVDFILDIGGQDMKSMKVHDGVIDNILLNEACSSGCGSFIETFAKGLGMEAAEFLEQGLFAQNPVDLGSRCTVFMNSMVKQAQKEGATIGDIAAGLSYSVIRNAVQKVIKARDPKSLGKKIVVQGGTFYGDAVLRSFELITGQEVIRPNLTGLIGAIGAALIAMDRQKEGQSSLISLEELENFSYDSTRGQCHRCTNNCTLIINKFSSGKRYITGNRCEKGGGTENRNLDLPNLYKYKYERAFDYKSLDIDKANRGTVGIPRVLNIYENYPFWHTFFTSLGFRVELSRESSREVYEKGLTTIPSETACYPAKISHGHIMDLLERDIKFIFYPSVFYEEKEDRHSDNHLNCPVVTGYPEVIKHNIGEIKDRNIIYLNPFVNMNNEAALAKELSKALKIFSITSWEVRMAVFKASFEQGVYREDIKREGERALKYLEENDITGIVLAGRPYHIDPAINHGIPELINSLGMAVLTEDSIAHLGKLDQPLRVLDQWTYHSRLYRAAELVSRTDNLEMIQLNSFGCGLDAVTVDQVQEILQRRHRIATTLKLDEISNLGAAKIRVRSLQAALKDRRTDNREVNQDQNAYEKLVFTKKNKKEHTILMPQMAPLQFVLLEKVLETEGYKIKVLDDVDGRAVDEGLRYVNNDACYPSIIVVGQFIDALKSGKYDTDNVSLLISQTGGVCRASNYVGFLRKALRESGFGHVPVISVSTQGIEKNPGFTYSYDLLRNAIIAIMLGDLLMRVSNRVRPYEKVAGSTNLLVDQWLEELKAAIVDMSRNEFIDYVWRLVEDFDKLEIRDIKKPKVGIVGEILVKYHPAANNELVDILEAEGAEAVLSDVTDFVLYCLYNANFKNRALGKSMKERAFSDMVIGYIEYYRAFIKEALEESERFHPPLKIEELGELASRIISLGNQSGEGWLLTAEMIELIEAGAENIVCVQPFGCLPNHITGKGMIKAIREIYPQANIVPIDYDPGASSVNQLNRLKLMLSGAEDRLHSRTGESLEGSGSGRKKTKLELGVIDRV